MLFDVLCYVRGNKRGTTHRVLFMYVLCMHALHSLCVFMACTRTLFLPFMYVYTHVYTYMCVRVRVRVTTKV
jgi:hypothetical protein